MSSIKGPWSTPEFPPGGQLIIRRGELGGYWAQAHNQTGMMSPVANFSTSDDLLEWVAMTIDGPRSVDND